MKKRQKEADDAYEAMWDGGGGSHHPDYDPYASGNDVVKASRETEELYNAIVKNDIKKVYKKIEEGADVNFVFGTAYRCKEGYTPLMVAAHRCAAAPVSTAEFHPFFRRLQLHASKPVMVIPCFCDDPRARTMLWLITWMHAA